MAQDMIELHRGPFVESIHSGDGVIATASGEVVASWGNPEAVVLPRSSVKMIQAVPLLESGAAERFGVSDEELALACASHQGAEIHTRRVAAWLERVGYGEADLLCGAQPPRDRPAREALRASGGEASALHNNCSGKHAGFLTLNRHLGASAHDYVNPDHPVQKAVRAAYEDLTGAPSPGYGIDGCSAPNFAARLDGVARAMAFFASAPGRSDSRSRAAARLLRAMLTHPLLVAGEGRACSELMHAMGGRVALKTGAEGVFVAALPAHNLGVALKIRDGATRASEAAIVAILVALGALDPQHPAALKRLDGPIHNWRALTTGHTRRAASFPGTLEF